MCPSWWLTCATRQARPLCRFQKGLEALVLCRMQGKSTAQGVLVIQLKYDGCTRDKGCVLLCDPLHVTLCTLAPWPRAAGQHGRHGGADACRAVHRRPLCPDWFPRGGGGCAVRLPLCGHHGWVLGPGRVSRGGADCDACWCDPGHSGLPVRMGPQSTVLPCCPPAHLPPGETPWVKQVIAEHHEEAKKKGLRIVPCCGFDSTPFDLGALLVSRRLATAARCLSREAQAPLAGAAELQQTRHVCGVERQAAERQGTDRQRRLASKHSALHACKAPGT